MGIVPLIPFRRTAEGLTPQNIKFLRSIFQIIITRMMLMRYKHGKSEIHWNKNWLKVNRTILLLNTVDTFKYC